MNHSACTHTPGTSEPAAPLQAIQSTLIPLFPQRSPQRRIQLRDYQTQMLREIYRAIRGNQSRVLAIAVMGAGKTVLASKIMSDAVSKGRRALFLVSLNCLLDQAAGTLEKFGIRCSVLQGDRDFDTGAPAIVASLQTIAARQRRGQSLGQILGRNFGVVFLDEAHITAWDKTYTAISDWLPNTAIIGLTATPWRLSKKQWLGQQFESAVIGPQPLDIIKMGGAVPARIFRLDGAIKETELKVRQGEYADSSIARQATTPESLAIVLNGYQEHCSDRPALMVGATVSQAQATADHFNQHGIKAEVITGKTSHRDRQAIIARLASGATQIICSVGCLTAGFDCPPVSAILFVRKTKSRALFHQVCGRGSRPHPGKTDYLILDFGNNQTHGNPMAAQDYSIAEPEQHELVTVDKACPACLEVVSIFVQICPNCGHEFSANTAADDGTEELIQGTLSERFTKQQLAQRQWLRDVRRRAFAQDENPSRCIQQFIDTHGFTPPKDWTHGAALGRTNASVSRRLQYVEYLERHCTEAKDVEGWLAYHCQLEFGCDFERLMELPGWWDVLRIPPDSGPEEVREAYRRASLMASTQADFHQLNTAIASAKADLQGVPANG
ncbi:MAG: DEAD/DEAH box helicase family protein [Cyanobacteria bacterium P01_D01_bin.73]